MPLSHTQIGLWTSLIGVKPEFSGFEVDVSERSPCMISGDISVRGDLALCILTFLGQIGEMEC